MGEKPTPCKEALCVHSPSGLFVSRLYGIIKLRLFPALLPLILLLIACSGKAAPPPSPMTYEEMLAHLDQLLAEAGIPTPVVLPAPTAPPGCIEWFESRPYYGEPPPREYDYPEPDYSDSRWR